MRDIGKSGVACAPFADVGKRQAEPRLTCKLVGMLISACLIAFSLKPIPRVARTRPTGSNGGSGLEALSEIAIDAHR
jgi:hypothetical protein